MLRSTAPKPATAGKAHDSGRTATPLFFRKVWLPKIFYESIPYFYLLAGLLAFLTTTYISEWFWVLPHYLLFSVACLHLGIIGLHRRRRARRDFDDRKSP